jgi:hypothetical protein
MRRNVWAVMIVFVGVLVAVGPAVAAQVWTMHGNPVLDIGPPDAWGAWGGGDR